MARTKPAAATNPIIGVLLGLLMAGSSVGISAISEQTPSSIEARLAADDDPRSSDSAPSTTSVIVKEDASAITTPQRVRVLFSAAGAEAASSPLGCVPATDDWAIAVGGTWDEPILQFFADERAKPLDTNYRTPVRSATCANNPLEAWRWQPASAGDVVISPP
jgi:hypothetical protein